MSWVKRQPAHAAPRAASNGTALGHGFLDVMLPAQGLQIALVVCTTVSQPDNVIDIRASSDPAFGEAHDAERMAQQPGATTSDAPAASQALMSLNHGE